MRRDHWSIGRGDSFTVALDTFYDRRNGFIFQTNLLGAIRDAQVIDERNENDDWNTVWNVQTTRFEAGWTVEMAIPFKSLRYQQRSDQVWGINVQRNVRWKNEQSFLSPIPASYSFGGINKFSSAATLVGIETPASSKNLELKPYGISTIATDRTATPSVSNDAGGDLGFDVKYGLTRGLTADFTVNTDFAQVEADEEQVNLTRFSLFFPEKREFFLEGQGVFNFGGRRNEVWGPGGDTPIMFYSRRIGLSDGGIVPIRAGGRVTGRGGRYTVGLLTMQAGESEAAGTSATNFSVVRIRRDIFPPQHHWRDGDPPLGGRRRHRLESGVRYRRQFRVLPESEHRYLLRAEPDAGPVGEGYELPGAGRETAGIATASSTSISWSVKTSSPKSVFCGVATSASTAASCASARDRRSPTWCASSRIRSPSSTSPTGRAWWRPARSTAVSRWSCRTATTGASSTRTATSFSMSRSLSPSDVTVPAGAYDFQNSGPRTS